MDLANNQKILDFWFGTSVGSFRKQWFRKDPNFDAQIKIHFLDVYLAMLASSADPWLTSAKASLARIIVLDQFARNMFRGTPQSFAADPQALATAMASIELGYDAQLLPIERFFLYLPLEHSEDMAHQTLCVKYFEALVQEAPELNHGLDYAYRHRDVIAQFGRFPHRNEILGRPSTQAELAFLSQPGSRF